MPGERKDQSELPHRALIDFLRRRLAAGVSGPKIRVRTKINFASHFKAISVFRPVRPKSRLYENQKLCFIAAIPPRQEGRHGRSSRKRGVGCDGRFTLARERGRMKPLADGKAVWS